MPRRKKKTQRKSRKQSRGADSKFYQALRRLKGLNASEQHQAMNIANASFIRKFCQQLKKLKHMKLPPKKRKALQRHRKQLRQLINAKTSMSKRRRILGQKGGGVLKDILKTIPMVSTILDIIDNV